MRAFLATRLRWPRHLYSFDDLVQAGLLLWLQQRQLYRADGGASAPTFLRRLAERHLLDIEDRLHAQKRGGGALPLSIDQAAPGHPDTNLGDLIPTPEGDPAAACEQAELRERIRQVPLTDRQRQVLAGMLDQLTPTEIHRRFGMSRPLVYLEMPAITRAIENAGLKTYLIERVQQPAATAAGHAT